MKKNGKKLIKENIKYKSDNLIILLKKQKVTMILIIYSNKKNNKYTIINSVFQYMKMKKLMNIVILILVIDLIEYTLHRVSVKMPKDPMIYYPIKLTLITLLKHPLKLNSQTLTKNKKNYTNI